MTRKQYSDETKAAVMAALLTGQSINSIAKEYSIPKSTVSRWKNGGVPSDGTQKKEIGDLIMAYVRTSLVTLEAQAQMFQDKDWLRKQNAADVAVLHGVQTDKAIRILEAISSQDD